MDVTSLYSSVLARGATLQVLCDGTLEVDGTELLGDALMAELRAHKPELLSLLRNQNGHQRNGHVAASSASRGPPEALAASPDRESAATAGAKVLAHATSIPDIFLDFVAPELSEGELRVMLYLLRRTLGFHKAADCISLKQFATGLVTRDGRRLDAGTGLQRPVVVRVLERLEQRGLVHCERAKAGSPGHATNQYRLRLDRFLEFMNGALS